MTIAATSRPKPWQADYTNGRFTGTADTTKQGVGGTAGLRPHELLEAALATCMTITARMDLAARDLDATGVGVTVEVIREDAATRFRYTLALPPALEPERETLERCLVRSPLRTTLSKPITYAPDVSWANGETCSTTPSYHRSRS